jgi:chromosome segregation ATPase
VSGTEEETVEEEDSEINEQEEEFETDLEEYETDVEEYETDVEESETDVEENESNQPEPDNSEEETWTESSIPVIVTTRSHLPISSSERGQSALRQIQANDRVAASAELPTVDVTNF